MQLNISDNPQETDKNAQTKARKRRSQDHKAQSSCKETRIMHRLQESEAGGKDRTICIVTSAGTLNQRVCCRSSYLYQVLAKFLRTWEETQSWTAKFVFFQRRQQSKH